MKTLKLVESNHRTWIRERVNLFVAESKMCLTLSCKCTNNDIWYNISNCGWSNGRLTYLTSTELPNDPIYRQNWSTIYNISATITRKHFPALTRIARDVESRDSEINLTWNGILRSFFKWNFTSQKIRITCNRMWLFLLVTLILQCLPQFNKWSPAAVRVTSTRADSWVNHRCSRPSPNEGLSPNVASPKK